MIIIYEKGSEFYWKDVCELVVGCIWNKFEVDEVVVDVIFFLNIIFVKYLKFFYNFSSWIIVFSWLLLLRMCVWFFIFEMLRFYYYVFCVVFLVVVI